MKYGKLFSDALNFKQKLKLDIGVELTSLIFEKQNDVIFTTTCVHLKGTNMQHSVLFQESS